jgi:hypothetical protein
MLTMLLGCAQTQQAFPPPSQTTAALLFDAQPGPVTASQMAVRDAWPSAEAYRDLGEEIHYRERFIDRQGDGFFGRGRHYVHRRFETRRTGRARR